MASLFTNGKFQAQDASGALSGALLHTYAAGTLTPLATYTDQGGGSPNTNPVVCDSDGQADVWLGTSAYRMILNTAEGTTVWDTDNITAATSLADLAAAGIALANVPGADPTGAADSSAALISALATYRRVDMSNGAWKISATVTIPANTHLDLRGATVTLATGSNPGFKFLTGAYLYIQGGMIGGTADSFLFCQGTSDTPASQADYASQIHLEGVAVSSATITKALDFDKAVKSVNVHGCNFFTVNGIRASGKCVEVMVSDSIIYSASGIAGTYGAKLRSTGGTAYYNEGWSFVGCTMDNFEITHDVTDVFVYQITGGYHGTNATLSATTGYAFKFQAPSTSLCELIQVGGGAVIAGRTLFLAAGSGQAYNAKIDAFWTNVPGYTVSLENNTSNVTITGRMKAASGGGAVGVVGANNNNDISADIEVDSTYVDAVILNGANGTGCYVDAYGPTSGDVIGAGRNNIRYGAKVPVHSAAVATFKQAYNASNLGGGAAYAVGVAISTQSVQFGRGEKGYLTVHLPFSGANATTQALQFTVPSGMVLPSGTGWDGSYIYLRAAAGLCHVRIPFYCTAGGGGNVVLTNLAGSTITIQDMGYVGHERSW